MEKRSTKKCNIYNKTHQVHPETNYQLSGYHPVSDWFPFSADLVSEMFWSEQWSREDIEVDHRPSVYFKASFVLGYWDLLSKLLEAREDLRYWARTESQITTFHEFYVC